jgi:hypothetical protein
MGGALEESFGPEGPNSLIFILISAKARFLLSQSWKFNPSVCAKPPPKPLESIGIGLAHCKYEAVSRARSRANG